MSVETWQRERAYRRRLYYLAPVATVLMTLLFLTYDRLPYREIERQVGWKGELRLMPEITIVPDTRETVDIERDRKSNTMTSVDLDLVDEGDVPKADRREAERPEKKEEIELSDLDEFDVQTRQTSREAPYSEDYVILKMVQPEYPPEELAKGVEGSVTVELLVNENGRVEKATVLSAIGPVSFQDSALEAVQQFVFQPPITDGKPSSMWIKFLIKFRIFG